MLEITLLGFGLEEKELKRRAKTHECRKNKDCVNKNMVIPVILFV